MTREEEALLVQQWYGIRIRLRVRVDNAVVHDHTVLPRVIVGQLLGRSEQGGASGSGSFLDAVIPGLQRTIHVPGAPTVRLYLQFYG